LQMTAGGHGGRFTYQYDGQDRLTNLTDWQGKTAAFSYDAADRRINEAAGGLVTTTVYDAANRVTDLTTTVPTSSVTLTNYSYRYDNLNNRLGVTEVDGTLVTWTYDSTYQLTGEMRTDAGGSSTLTYNTTYTYDPVGNRLVKWDSGALTTSTYDAANQLQTAIAPSGVTTYTYDMAGNLQLESGPAGITTTTWDDENRQVLVAPPTGVPATMSYNADGQRFRIVVGPSSPQTHYMLWDGQAYLGFGNPSNPLVTIYTQEPTTYGGLLFQASTSLPTPIYHVFDALGSTVFTWHQGAIGSTLVYKAFGEFLNGDPGASSGSPFFWVGRQGYYYDASTVTYQVRRRPYLSVIGKWSSEDPIGFAEGQANLTVYVRNSPTTFTDPSGLKDVDTGVKRCLAYTKGGWIFSWFPQHAFVEIDGHGYGRFEKGKNSFGTAVIKSDDASVYPEKNPAQVADGQSYSVCTPVILDDCDYNIDVFRQDVRNFIAEQTANPGSYSSGNRDCFDFVRQTIGHGVWKARITPWDKGGPDPRPPIGQGPRMPL
jgi:RHS repeat-associated protein